MPANELSSPPTDLPADSASFWGVVPADLLTIDAAETPEVTVLDQLGAAPFKKLDKGGFPFLGFLAGVYEHVSSTAANVLRAPVHPHTST